jgi:hypothetical protein
MFREKRRPVSTLKIKLSTAIAGALALLFPLSGIAMAKRAPRTVNLRNPRLKHVFIVLEENLGYAAAQQKLAAGNMPTLQALMQQGAVANNYFADTHPSIGNYFELTTGNIITNDDSFVGPIDTSKYTDVVKLFDATDKLRNGKPAPHPVTWKLYAEDLPNPPTGPGNGDPYEMHHNPFAYFPEVINNPADQANLVDTSVLATDIQNSTLPNYGFIVPNAYHSGHTPDPNAPQGQDPEVEVDDWLKTNIVPLVQAMNSQDGLVMIVWDEGDGADEVNGGGQILAVLDGAKVKPGYQSTNLYQHQSPLRLMLQAVGIKTFPGDAADAPQMGEFFHR